MGSFVRGTGSRFSLSLGERAGVREKGSPAMRKIFLTISLYPQRAAPRVALPKNGEVGDFVAGEKHAAFQIMGRGE